MTATMQDHCPHHTGTLVDPADHSQGSRCDECGQILPVNGHTVPYPIDEPDGRIPVATFMVEVDLDVQAMADKTGIHPDDLDPVGWADEAAARARRYLEQAAKSTMRAKAVVVTISEPGREE